MLFRSASLLILLETLHFTCPGQGMFSTGFKIGAGGSPLPLGARLDVEGSVSRVYAGTTLATGAIVSYMIGNRIGIESGFSVIHYSYYRSEEDFWRRRVWKGSATLELVDFQVPLSIIYRHNIPSRPYRYISFAGGTSIDWLSDIASGPYGPLWLKNVCGAVRLGKETMKAHNVEYGLEFQYTLDRFLFQGRDYDQQRYGLDSRLALVSLNFTYFFWRKPVGVG